MTITCAWTFNRLLDITDTLVIYSLYRSMPNSSKQLFYDLGHLVDTKFAQALLRGDYIFPEECEERTEAII